MPRTGDQCDCHIPIGCSGGFPCIMASIGVTVHIENSEMP